MFFYIMIIKTSHSIIWKCTHKLLNLAIAKLNIPSTIGFVQKHPLR